MHTHNKTYLAGLGFQDKDKNHPLHDLAGQYLGEQTVGERLAAVFKPYPESCRKKRLHDPEETWGVSASNFNYFADVEVPLMKGEGKYQTYVGFIDAHLYWCWTETWTPPPGSRKEAQTHHTGEATCVLVEVKINPVPLGDILRQIGLYQTFVNPPRKWALATTYAVSAHDVEVLEQKGITHLQLGEDFDHYCEWRRQNMQPSEKSVKL